MVTHSAETGERGPLRRSLILLGTRHTSLFSRFVAKAIDLLVVVAIFFLGKAFLGSIGIGCAVLFSALQDGFGEGQSIGKRIIGLRVIDDSTGGPCTFLKSFVRNLPFTLALLPMAASFLWGLVSLVTLPLLALEAYLVAALDSGVRLGDVLGNTLVVEYAEDLETFQ